MKKSWSVNKNVTVENKKGPKLDEPKSAGEAERRMELRTGYSAKGNDDPEDDVDDEPEEETPVESVPVKEDEESADSIEERASLKAADVSSGPSLRDAPKVASKAKVASVPPDKPLDPHSAWVAGENGPPLISKQELSKATIREQHYGANPHGYQGNEMNEKPMATK